MKFIKFVTALALLYFVGDASAQARAPRTLVQALYCLKMEHGGWLNSSLAEQLRLRANFMRDVTSDPGKEHFIVVLLESGSKGQVFDLVRTRHAAQTSWKIENNGNFLVTKSQIEFVDVLGGTWTQEHLERNVKQALLQKGFLVDAKALTAGDSKIACSCYADH
jgi:hypothetical protein